MEKFETGNLEMLELGMYGGLTLVASPLRLAF